MKYIAQITVYEWIIIMGFFTTLIIIGFFYWKKSFFKKIFDDKFLKSPEYKKFIDEQRKINERNSNTCN